MPMDYTAIDRVVLAGYRDPLPSHVEGVRLASIQGQADLAEQAKTYSLYFCPDAWALRHRFVSHETGEIKRARCDRWNCLYCGPRKTDQWRQLIAEAKPTLHLVLSRAGHTVEEAARALTTCVQYLRRGSKGRGKEHSGERASYPIEYFAVLERHRNFEETGFHWHVLVVGVDFIPKVVIDAAWESATHGLNKWAFVKPVKNNKAIGYVTKYLTKDVTRQEKGTRAVQQDREVLVVDEQGNRLVRQVPLTTQMTSAARRIRYSCHFFPESVEALRFKLFSQLDDPEHPEQLERDVTDCRGGDPDIHGREMGGAAAEDVAGDPPLPAPRRASWSLYEAEPYSEEYQAYLTRRRRALLESLMDVRAGTWHVSGRVLSVWSFQRSKHYHRADVARAEE